MINGIIANQMWLPTSLFLSGEQGNWLDTPDFSTLFQVAAGTTPVTAAGQQDGLALDKRLGLVRGAEAFSDSTLTFTAPSARISPGVYRIYSSDGSFSNMACSGMLVGKWYEVSLTIDSIATTGGGIVVDWSGAPSFTTVGVKRLRILSTSTTFSIKRASTACDYQVSNISVREIAGNHAYQTTLAARPTVAARVNLFVYSNELSGGSWSKAEATATANSAPSFDGSMTAATITGNASTGVTRRLVQAQAILPSKTSVTFRVKAGTQRYVQTYIATDGAPYVNFDLVAGVASAFGGATAYIEAVGNGYYDCTMTCTTALAGCYSGYLHFIDSLAASRASTHSVGSTTLYAARASLVYGERYEYPYQRVNAATDYVDIGAPRYLSLDKTDDHLLVAAGGAGTTGFLLVAGIMVPADGTARTLWSDRGTNAGYKVGIDTSNQIFLSAGDGAAFVTATGPALVAGTKYVITAWHDGANLNVSVNNGAATQAAFATATAGTATFTIGKSNGEATEYWGDRIYGMVYRKNDTSAASQRSSLYSYMVGKMGGL